MKLVKKDVAMPDHITLLEAFAFANHLHFLLRPHSNCCILCKRYAVSEEYGISCVNDNCYVLKCLDGTWIARFLTTRHNFIHINGTLSQVMNAIHDLYLFHGNGDFTTFEVCCERFFMNNYCQLIRDMREEDVDRDIRLWQR